jgi:hypothetical protein
MVPISFLVSVIQRVTFSLCVLDFDAVNFTEILPRLLQFALNFARENAVDIEKWCPISSVL